MVSVAQWKSLRISPRKMRLIADVIRGKKADEAFAILSFTNKKGAPLMSKVLKSAVSNAITREDIKVKQEELFISKVLVNEAPRLKRWRAISRGRAVPYMHRFSHVIIELDVESRG